MTCGIYIMYWNIDNPYIGQSIDIPKRKIEHYSSIRSGVHYNYKIRKEYAKFNTYPIFETLIECSRDTLDTNECIMITEFDSIANGLNITSGGDTGGIGTNNANSKYAEEQLLEVLKLLTNSTLNFNDISELTGVKRDTISSIFRGTQHIWLQDKYPNLYRQIIEIRNNPYPIVLSPSGGIFTITTKLIDFCKVHGLYNYSMYDLFKGKIKQHKGWKLYNPLNSQLN